MLHSHNSFVYVLLIFFCVRTLCLYGDEVSNSLHLGQQHNRMLQHRGPSAIINLKDGRMKSLVLNESVVIEFLDNDVSVQAANMRNRFASTQSKEWFRFTGKAPKNPKAVFSDVCYELSGKTKSFVYKYIFPSGDNRIFSKAVGYRPGQGGRHAESDKGVAPVSADPKMWTYPATEGQDRLVLHLLDHKRNGFFVDLAARYWQRGSNSFALETYYDWQGICIEPDNIFSRGLVLNRTCLVVCNNPVTNRDHDVVFFNYKINGYNKRGNEYGEKVTVTLNTILDASNAPRKMDYLSLDVEDHELAVLSKFNFNKYQFQIMTIERPVMALHRLLNKHKYRWLTQLRGNFGETVYIHESIANFQEKMNRFRPRASCQWRGQMNDYMLVPVWNATLSKCKTCFLTAAFSLYFGTLI